jgi:type II secretory pathway component GspD/PulD (secretin)
MKDGKPLIKNGFPVYGPKVLTADAGVQLRVSTRILANGMLKLQIETETVEVSAVELPRTPSDARANEKRTEVLPPFNSQVQRKAAMLVPEAATVVLRDVVTAADRGTTGELLWIITPHVIRNEKKTAEGTVPPAAEPQPVPTPPPLVPPPAVRP